MKALQTLNVYSGDYGICLGQKFIEEKTNEIPAAEAGKLPVVMYPGECYYCGACVMECPRQGAIHLEHPLMNRTKCNSSDNVLQFGLSDAGQRAPGIREPALFQCSDSRMLRDSYILESEQENPGRGPRPAFGYP